MKYKPDHKYLSDMSVRVNLKVNMTGNDQALEKLKSQGLTMPLVLNGGVNINGNVITGKEIVDESFPMTVSFALQNPKINLNGKPIDLLKGKNLAIKIHAHNYADGHIKADSSIADGKKDTAEKSISGILSTVQRQINFPDRPLKVGDTFDQNAPMNLPGNANISADAKATNIHTIYTLTQIADGKAYFDMTIKGEMQMSVKNADVKISCNGPGKLVYSINDNFPLSVTSNITFKLNVTLGTTVVDGTADFAVTNIQTIN